VEPAPPVILVILEILAVVAVVAVERKHYRLRTHAGAAILIRADIRREAVEMAVVGLPGDLRGLIVAVLDLPDLVVTLVARATQERQVMHLVGCLKHSLVVTPEMVEPAALVV
jgi:hypothetical protein